MSWLRAIARALLTPPRGHHEPPAYTGPPPTTPPPRPPVPLATRSSGGACPACGGTGDYANVAPCPTCQGSGLVPRAPA